MRFFIRLNVSSFLYALFPFAVLELMANVYRISRVTGWELSHVNKLILAFCVAGIILSSIVFPRLIRRWLDGRKACYFSLVDSLLCDIGQYTRLMAAHHPSSRST